MTDLKSFSDLQLVAELSNRKYCAMRFELIKLVINELLKMDNRNLQLIDVLNTSVELTKIPG